MLMTDIPHEKTISPESEERGSKDEGQNAAPILRAELQIPHSITDTYNAEQRKKNRFEWWKLVVETITLIVIFIYTCIAYHQWTEMRKATDAANISANAAKKSGDVAEETLIALQRPWLSVHMEIVSDFKISKVANQQDTITIRFIVKNVGNSPALGIDIQPRIYILGPWVNILSEERQICDLGSGPKILKKPLLGYALFPNDHFIQDISLGISHKDIEQFRMKITEFTRSINSPPPNKNYIYLALVGCVRYRFGFDGSLHKTGFIEEINRVNPRYPNETFGINITGSDIPSNMLILKQSAFGVGMLAD